MKWITCKEDKSGGTGCVQIGSVAPLRAKFPLICAAGLSLTTKTNL